MNAVTEGQLFSHAYILREGYDCNVAVVPLSVYDVRQSRRMTEQRSDTHIHAGFIVDKTLADKVRTKSATQYEPCTIRIGKWTASSTEFMPLLHTLIEVQQVWFESTNCALGAPVRIFIQEGDLYLDMNLLKPAAGYESQFDAYAHKKRLERLFTLTHYKYVKTRADALTNL